MKNLLLIPDTHIQQKIIRADFAFDKELIFLINKASSQKWLYTIGAKVIEQKV